jgi:alpha-tubulin suppressor-like RCC1 family protein
MMARVRRNAAKFDKIALKVREQRRPRLVFCVMVLCQSIPTLKRKRKQIMTLITSHRALSSSDLFYFISSWRTPAAFRVVLFVLLLITAAFLPLPASAQRALTGVSNISAGYYHACGLTALGGVKCWGDNRGGQIGDGTFDQRTTPTDVVGLTGGVVALAAGGFHTCALTAGGGVKCWGTNFSGELGDGTSVPNRNVAVDVIGLGSGVKSIASGFYHTCAVTAAGGAKCWGYNRWGALGDNSTQNRLLPTDVNGLSAGVAAITAGGFHTCAKTSAGGAKCWGYNGNAQLGDATTTDRLVPVDVAGLSSGVASIAPAYYHTCALLVSGGVKCWGDNSFGALGDGSTTQRDQPVDVVGLTSGVAKLANMSTMGYYSCAVTLSGSAKCWGYNNRGQLGDTTVINRLTPVDVAGLLGSVSEVTGGAGYACALVASGGGVKCWGDNFYGTLGDNTSTQRLVPAQVSGFANGISKVALNASHACALTTGGAVKCWGNNEQGQLGDNSVVSRLSPVDVTGLGSGVSAIAVGGIHTCALTAAGGVKCWGNNSFGQLGDGTFVPKRVATDVPGLTANVLAISAGYLHTCALITGGAMKCWGANSSGQLGDGTDLGRSVPTDVSGLGGAAAAITAGDAHTCALLATGAARCWGNNSSGQLGDATTTARLSPADVLSLNATLVSISAGSAHTCGVTSAGGIKCWGFNNASQLGDGTAATQLSPVDVIQLGGSASIVAAGLNNTCARLSNGSVKCWGANSFGQIGDNSQTIRPIPAQVVGLTADATMVAVGGYTTCAVKTSGALLCWGSNDQGQVGDGTTPYRTNTADVVYFPRVPNDVSADGKSDIVYRDGAGAVSAILMNGVLSGPPANILPAGSGWTVTHTADFNGDGKADILIKNSDGRIAVLLMNGTSVASFNPLVGAATGYTPVVTGDFNADGKADIVLKNADGSIAVLLMNGAVVASAAYVVTAGSPYDVTHAGDFNGDGKSDLVLKHTDGSAVILLMNGTAVTAANILLGAGSPWSVSQIADLSGDGKADIIIKNTDGSVAMLLMNGTTVASAAFLLTAGSPYIVTHTGDFNGDGKADLLIRNTNGSVVLLQMNGTAVTAATFLLLAGSTATVAQVADYNGDGRSDILLRNADGSATVVLMNGGVVAAAANVWGAGTLQVVP